MTTLTLYVLAAIAEIAGCYAVWAVARLGASKAWLIPGVVALILFAVLLTRVDVAAAGRAYAIYGGIYIAASLGWLWLIERQPPDRFDLIGSGIAIVGALIILYAPRAA